MANDKQTEPKLSDYLTFAQAVLLVPGEPSPATAWRWSTKGVGGKRLRSLRVGGKVFTTAAWVAEFLAACSEPVPVVDPDPVATRRRPSDKARQRRIDEAKRELAAR